MMIKIDRATEHGRMWISIRDFPHVRPKHLCDLVFEELALVVMDRGHLGHFRIESGYTSCEIPPQDLTVWPRVHHHDRVEFECLGRGY